MVQKLTDAMGFIKAKIKRDELEELLLQVTSQENYQASTKNLHQISNAAYNYQKWQKIQEFIYEKLKKSKSWRKILKTLSLIEFLLKNGPPSIIATFKYDIYQFRSFENFSNYEDGVDRGQSIRIKAKTLVQLLSNQQLLEQQRIKAKNIRQKMSGVLGGMGSYGSYSSQNRGNSNWGNDLGSGKYESYNSKTYGSSSNSSDNWGSQGLGLYGSYNTQKSTLDKYKDKFLKQDKSKADKYGLGASLNDSNTQQPKFEQSKKPFQSIAPKLNKPGTTTKPTPKKDSPTKPAPTPAKKDVGNLLDDDILGSNVSSSGASSNGKADGSLLLGNNTSNQTQSQAVISSSTNSNPNNLIQNQNISNQNQLNSNPNLINQNQINNNFQQQYPNNLPFNQQMQQQNSNIYGQNGMNQMQMNQMQMNQMQMNQMQMNQMQMNQMQSNPMQMNQIYQNPYGNQMNPNIGMNYANVNQGYNPQMYNAYQQNTIYGQPMINQMYSTTASMAANVSLQSQQKAQPQTNQISLSASKTKVEEDQFGGFTSAADQNVKWLSNQEKNLTDLSAFGSQFKVNTQNKKKQKDNEIKIDMWTW